MRLFTKNLEKLIQRQSATSQKTCSDDLGSRIRYLSTLGLSGPQGRSGNLEQKHFLPLSGMEPRFLPSPACCLVTIPTIQKNEQNHKFYITCTGIKQYFHNILCKYIIIRFVKLNYSLHWQWECSVGPTNTFRPDTEGNARVTGKEAVFITFFAKHFGHSTLHFHCIVHQVLQAKYSRRYTVDAGFLKLLKASVKYSEDTRFSVWLFGHVESSSLP